MSPILNFTTSFPTGSKEPFKFIVYGDMGVSTFPRADETAKLMLKEYHENDVKFIFHNGDISYARGHVSFLNSSGGIDSGWEIASLRQGWAQDFSNGWLTLLTRGLKYGFQGSINSRNHM